MVTRTAPSGTCRAKESRSHGRATLYCRGSRERFRRIGGRSDHPARLVGHQSATSTR